MSNYTIIELCSTKLNTMIRVYKTNIRQQSEADKILSLLSKELPSSSINFDLEDIDNILRVDEYKDESSDKIIKMIFDEGYWIEELRDELNTSDAVVYS